MVVGMSWACRVSSFLFLRKTSSLGRSIWLVNYKKKIISLLNWRHDNHDAVMTDTVMTDTVITVLSDFDGGRANRL